MFLLSCLYSTELTRTREWCFICMRVHNHVIMVIHTRVGVSVHACIRVGEGHAYVRVCVCDKQLLQYS